MIEKLLEKLDNEIFTDEIKLELSTIFESHLNEAIAEKEKQLQEEFEKKTKEFQEGLVEKVEEYLNLFIDEFITENKEQLVDAIKVQQAEIVLESFKEFVKQFGLQIQPEKLQEDVEKKELKEKVNQLTQEKIEMEKELKEAKKLALIVSRLTEFDTTSEKEKFIEMAESLQFEDEESFNKKLDVFVKTVKKLNEKVEESENKDEEKETQIIKEEKENITTSTIADELYEKYKKFL